MSLFTWALLSALQGAPEAQQDRFLTINTLFDFVCSAVLRESKSYGTKQTPARKLLEQGGSMILGNFNAPLIQPGDINFDTAPIKAIEFEERDAARVDEVLRSIRNYNYSIEYLETRVNDNLGSHFGDTLGELACTLAQALGFELSEVNVEGRNLLFPAAHTQSHTKPMRETRRRELLSIP